MSAGDAIEKARHDLDMAQERGWSGAASCYARKIKLWTIKNEMILEALERNKNLKAHEFRSQVDVLHSDGSEFHLMNAVVEEDEVYLIVYSEHNQPMVFHKDDLESWERKDLHKSS